MGDSPGYGLQATGYRAEDGLIFDAGKLHEQLSGLLQLYLARASDAEAVKQCSAKDAITCVKTLTAMMSDLQSGKPKSRSGGLQTATPLISRPGGLRAKACRESRVNGPITGGTGDSPVTTPNKSRAGQPGLLNEESSRYSLFTRRSLGEDGHATRYSPILESALADVLSTDEESHLEEPYQRFIARADRLCKEVRKRLDTSFVGAHHAVPVAGPGKNRSVVQPFRAGSSDDKTRAKALDYRENTDMKSRAREPSLPVEDSSVIPNNQKLTAKNRIRAAPRCPT